MANQEINPINMLKTADVFMPVCKAWEDEVEKSASGKPARYIQTVVSGLKEDRDNEVMDQKAIDGMISQFKSGSIGFFPDHGLDAHTGQRTYSWKQMMGKWVDATQEGDSLKATLRLNNAHPDADLLWSYVQEQMPLGFSIGARAIEVADE